MQNRFLSLWKTALDLIYPRQCQMCGDTVGCQQFSFLCENCFEGAARLEPPWCNICALPFYGKVDGDISCSNCSGRELHFDYARAVMRFQGVVRHAIHGFKYSRQTYWSQVLCAWLLRKMPFHLDFGDVDIVLPVPLHSVRERERGFNQAWVLFAPFMKRWGIPVYRQALLRVRETETQAHLDREERMLNLQGAFRVPAPKLVFGKRVLLVDDVLTTGSTVSECGRVLREAGAVSVLVFTLARG